MRSWYDCQAHGTVEGAYIVERISNTDNIAPDLSEDTDQENAFRGLHKSFTPHTTTTTTCSCQFPTHHGLPCRHIMKVLDHLSTKQMPEDLIHNVWLRQSHSISATIPKQIARFQESPVTVDVSPAFSTGTDEKESARYQRASHVGTQIASIVKKDAAAYEEYMHMQQSFLAKLKNQYSTTKSSGNAHMIQTLSPRTSGKKSTKRKQSPLFAKPRKTKASQPS
jgi:hypothetical protein